MFFRLCPRSVSLFGLQTKMTQRWWILHIRWAVQWHVRGHLNSSGNQTVHFIQPAHLILCLFNCRQSNLFLNPYPKKVISWGDRGVFLTGRHEMGPAELSHESLRFILMHSRCPNLLSKRALSYSSLCQQRHLSHYYPYHCQHKTYLREKENKSVTN